MRYFILFGFILISCGRIDSDQNENVSNDNLSDSLVKVAQSIQDSAYLEFYNSGQLKCATDMIIEKLQIKSRICFSDKFGYRTLEIKGEDTIVIEHPLHVSHEIFDRNFDLLFKVTYDDELNVINKYGQSLIYTELVNDEIRVNDTIDARFFIPDLLWTKQKIKITLKQNNQIIDEKIIKKDSEFGLYFYNYEVKESGDYNIIAISLFNNKDIDDDKLKVSDTIKIPLKVFDYVNT